MSFEDALALARRKAAEADLEKKKKKKGQKDEREEADRLKAEEYMASSSWKLMQSIITNSEVLKGLENYWSSRRSERIESNRFQDNITIEQNPSLGTVTVQLNFGTVEIQTQDGPDWFQISEDIRFEVILEDENVPPRYDMAFTKINQSPGYVREKGLYVTFGSRQLITSVDDFLSIIANRVLFG